MDYLEIFMDELKECIECPDIENPYYEMNQKDQSKTIPDTTFHFAKDLLNDETKTIDMLTAVSETGISGFEFLSLCSAAHHKSGADIYGWKGQPNRLSKGKAIKSLDDISTYSKKLRKSLDNEPSPLMLDVALMGKFDISYKAKENEVPRIGSLDEILKEVVKMTEKRKKRIEEYGTGVASKTAGIVVKNFVVHLHKHFLDVYNKRIPYKHIAILSTVCLNIKVETSMVERSING